MLLVASHVVSGGTAALYWASGGLVLSFAEFTALVLLAQLGTLTEGIAVSLGVYPTWGHPLPTGPAKLTGVFDLVALVLLHLSRPSFFLIAPNLQFFLVVIAMLVLVMRVMAPPPPPREKTQ
jgi:hypothetical protein